MNKHILKCWPEFFEPIASGRKNFGVRRNDRDFKVGDIVVLQKFDPNTGYVWDKNTEEFPPMIHRRITFVLDGGRFGIEPGYVVLALGLEQAEAAAE